jgi:1-acyl-sn-glycerol-3-phosphate acyltransferase
MQKFSNWILKKFGWTLKGDFPDLKKYVVIVVPHTTNWDFVLGLLVRSARDFHVNFIGKETLFIAPWGFIFRKLGGYSIKRDKNHNQVDLIVELINSQEEFRLAIAPEGTRSDVDRWRTGFYWIAKGAKIPIIMVAFDWSRREVRFSQPFYSSNNKEDDFTFMHKYFEM